MHEKGALISNIKGGHTGIIYSLARINEDQIASACADHKIRIFSLTSRTPNVPLQEF
jgi:hypothetical protein